MPLQRRLPKRGFKSLAAPYKAEIRLSDLEKLPVDEVDMLALKQAGLVPELARVVRIVLSGALTKKVTVKGLIGTRQTHRATVRGLGLRRINSVAELEDTPAVRGMINKVSYLVKVVS